MTPKPNPARALIKQLIGITETAHPRAQCLFFVLLPGQPGMVGSMGISRETAVEVLREIASDTERQLNEKASR